MFDNQARLGFPTCSDLKRIPPFWRLGFLCLLYRAPAGVERRFLNGALGNWRTELTPEWHGVGAEPIRRGRRRGMYRYGSAARRADLLLALPRPQRPCPVKAPNLPPPGAEGKSRRSPRTAPAATRSRNPRPGARAARLLLPQVSTAATPQENALGDQGGSAPNPGLSGVWGRGGEGLRS